MIISRETKTERYILSTLPIFYTRLGKRDGSAFLSDDGAGQVCTVTGALWTAQGRQFDGNDDKIAIGLGLGSAGTIQMWLKTAIVAGASQKSFFSSEEDINNSFSMFNWNDGKSYWGWRVGGVDKRVAITTAFPSGFFLATLAWDTATGITNLYFNLTSQGTTTGLSSVSAMTLYKPKLGCRNNVGTDDLFAACTIGEVLVYNRALSALEIQRNYLLTRWRY